MLTTHDLAGRWMWAVDEAGVTPLPDDARALIGRQVEAQVPGAVHADLLTAGVIPDPLVDANELQVEWVSRCDWRLSRGFAASDLTVPEPAAAERVDLVFDGIDTVATVLMNGREVGATRNMHRTYRFDVTSDVRERNDIEVRFTSPYTEAESWQQQLGARPSAYPEPFAFIRKMASSFGWDWGPTLPGCGLWRGVRLESWSTARIASVRPLVTVFEATGILTAEIEVERSSAGADRPLRVHVDIAGQTVRTEIAPGQHAATVVVAVPDARLWFPRGHGAAELYGVTVSLWDQDDRLDEHRTRIGFRTVAVDRTPDAEGTPFMVSVNGVPVFVRGVNWIPESVFPGTVPDQQVRRRLTQAAEANVNLVRVWGGGVYESEAFYSACDELGLLVWQDFLFACAAYPEDEPFRSEVLAEARENITRLSPHPSLAIWNGNNENLWMRLDKDWAAQPGGDLSWGERFYLDWLPRELERLDATRPYTEGSPWSGSWQHDPNDVDHQTFHSWDAWNEDDFSVYRESAPRFVSEFGWQGAATWRTLRDAVTDPQLRVDSDNVRHHQKAIDGHAKLERNLARHLPRTDDFDRWHLQTQWMQVEAVRTGLLHWRSHWPRTAGTIVWQLNDLWPVTSWAAIDSAGRCKPLYFALRDAYAPRAISIEPADDAALTLCVVNDDPDEWRATASISRVGADGVPLARASFPVTVPPRSVTRVDVPRAVSHPDDPRSELVVADVAGLRAVWSFVAARDARPGAPLQISSVAVDGGIDITVTCAEVARDVLVQPDRIDPDATVDRGFATILPGERVVFAVRSPSPIAADAASAAFVVTSLRDIIEPD